MHSELFGVTPTMLLLLCVWSVAVHQSCPSVYTSVPVMTISTLNSVAAAVYSVTRSAVVKFETSLTMVRPNR